ncbi:MAG: hypothetical protein GXP62_00640 [Oligoflexia bacterium]|nr:hypothetical protein [Oligoflexia bacterium]
MSTVIDKGAIARARAIFAGLAALDERPVSGLPAVPDILVCSFDRGSDAFRVVYADHTALSLWRDDLADVGDRGWWPGPSTNSIAASKSCWRTGR